MAKVKIPKRVAGVKLPKKVRKHAKKAVKAVEAPMVREFAAAALGAVAEVGVTRAKARAVGNGRAIGRTVRIDADQLAETIRSAAMDGIRRFLEGFDEGMRDLSRRAAAEAEAEDEDDVRRSRTPATRRPRDADA